MTLQTSYLDTHGTAYAGAIANTEYKTLISRTVEDSGGIAFGLAVMQGVDDDGIVVGDGSAFLGVVVREQSLPATDPAFDGFGYLAEARIMAKGVIWVANSGGVAAGDPVAYLADGALGTGSSPLIPNARWDSTAGDGELAKLRLG
jgi:subtilisin family serine protease